MGGREGRLVEFTMVGGGDSNKKKACLMPARPVQGWRVKGGCLRWGSDGLMGSKWVRLTLFIWIRLWVCGKRLRKRRANASRDFIMIDVIELEEMIIILGLV